MLSHLTEQPFVGSEAVAAGLVTPGRLRGAEFTPLYRDVYVGSSIEVDIGVRVRAVSLRVGPGAVVAGPLASLAWNVDCPWDDVEAVAHGSRRLRADGIRLRCCLLTSDEVATRFGVAVTSPERTAFDLARRDDALVEVVAAVDALAHGCRFDRRSIDRAVDTHPGVRGLGRARQVADLMDPRAESLPETRLRLLFVLRDFPSPAVQHPVRLADGTSYRLDLAWPDAKVAIEYDGEDHRTSERHASDLDRELELKKLGWHVIRVTARQLYRRTDELAAYIAGLLGS